MKAAKKGPITAAQLLERLNSDPEFVRRQREREGNRLELERLLSGDEKPLVDELASAGCAVKSVWDLVNTRLSYPAAIPILVKHLGKPYHPKNIEGIARALAVPEARGVHADGILRELQRRREKANDQVRFALVNALATAGDASMRPAMEALLDDPSYDDLHDCIRLVVGKIASRSRR